MKRERKIRSCLNAKVRRIEKRLRNKEGIFRCRLNIYKGSGENRVRMRRDIPRRRKVEKKRASPRTVGCKNQVGVLPRNKFVQENKANISSSIAITYI
jgi:hypothetical protein